MEAKIGPNQYRVSLALEGQPVQLIFSILLPPALQITTEKLRNTDERRSTTNADASVQVT